MSYYTLIEDEEARKLSFTGPVEVPSLPEKFSDWHIVAMAGYMVFFGLLTLVLAQCLDSRSWK